MPETVKAYSETAIDPLVSTWGILSSIFFGLEMDCFLSCFGASFN